MSRTMRFRTAFRSSLRSPERLASGRKLAVECLEDRRVLTTLYVDFGSYGTSFTASSSAINNVAGVSNSGPPLSVPNVTFTPFSAYDYNNSGAFNNQDVLDLRADVISLMARTLEPFDIDIVSVTAASFAQITSTLTSNAASNDAYVLVSKAEEAADSPNPNSGGQAGILDLNATGLNANDELALVYAGNIYNRLVSDGVTPGTLEFKEKYATRLAHFVLHEAFHTFGLDHTSTVFATDAMRLLADGDVVASRLSVATNLDNSTIVTRADLFTTFTLVGANPNNYEVVSGAGNLGLRDSDNDGTPDMSYVTGTGAYDKIQLELYSPDIVRVTVSSYTSDSYAPSALISYPTQIGGHDAIETYYIDLSEDTEGLILVDASHSNDLIEIDAAIPASFKIRGGTGNDQVRIIGSSAGSQIRAFVLEGEAGDDSLTVDFSSGDPLPMPGFDFQYVGGAGADIAYAIDSSGTRPAFFVDSSTDAVDANPGDSIANDAAGEVTLRAAIEEANDAGSSNPTYIFLPAGTYGLSNGAGDLDVSSSIKIFGTGAGSSIVDGLSEDRIFDIAAALASQLEINRVTLTGGYATENEYGGAIRVGVSSTDGAELTVIDSAIVSNAATQGGGIYVSNGAMAWIERSVVTGNFADAGGGIYASGSLSAWLTDTIIGKNYAAVGADLRTTGSAFVSLSGNMIGTLAGSNLTDDASVYVDNGSKYIVTSVVDSFASSAINVSVREAIDAANVASGASEIWLSNWSFTLTRKRTTSPTSTDIDVSHGDLDISDSLTIRAVDGASVAWDRGIADDVFDLLGDYDDDNDVDLTDFSLWKNVHDVQGYDPSVDGDEDGDVDLDDFQLVSDNFYETLSLYGIDI